MLLKKDRLKRKEAARKQLESEKVNPVQEQDADMTEEEEASGEYQEPAAEGRPSINQQPATEIVSSSVVQEAKESPQKELVDRLSRSLAKSERAA